MKALMTGFAVGVVVVTSFLAGVGLLATSSEAHAQAASVCKVIYNGNVTLFERWVAEQMDKGWVVKGGIYKDSNGWGVLTCSR